MGSLLEIILLQIENFISIIYIGMKDYGISVGIVFGMSCGILLGWLLRGRFGKVQKMLINGRVFVIPCNFTTTDSSALYPKNHQ